MSSPALSFVLAGNDLAETAAVRESLRRQTVADQIELILVLPPEAEIEEEHQLWGGLWSGQIVRVPEVVSRGVVNAAGVRVARAPIIALGEDHAYPEPRWAEALLEDHRGPWAVVGPQVRNANPGSALSWADFVIGYGPWSRPEAAGESTFLPGHNSSYKREALDAVWEDLERVLNAETLLHWDLAQQGRGLWLSGDAVIHHLNFSKLGIFVRAQYLNGRCFAGFRSEGWGWPRRLLYAAGSPLIPFVRAWRLRSSFRRSKGGPELVAPLRSVPALMLALFIDSVGQALGYLLGAGGNDLELARYEFCRTRFVTPSDRANVEANTSLS